MIELLNIDCLEYMKGVPDKYFELAIVDPPYGLGASDWDSNDSMFRKTDKWKGCRKSGYEIKGWDKEPPSVDYFKELFRVSENQIVFGANHFISKMPFDSAGWIVWDKKTSGNFSDCELAWCSIGGSVKKFEWLWNGFQKQRPEERIHPTQKPKQLYKWLLHNYAKPGDKILDTHGGSMSIAIACHQMGFDLTLCEIDKDYYDAGVKRFKEQTMQQSLFK